MAAIGKGGKGDSNQSSRMEHSGLWPGGQSGAPLQFGNADLVILLNKPDIPHLNSILFYGFPDYSDNFLRWELDALPVSEP